MTESERTAVTAYHVEIRRGMQRAREFNLDEATVLRKIAGPWVRGEAIAFGDHKWQPRDARLSILNGPALDTADLRFGQGWTAAERSSRDVTADVLAHVAAPTSPRVSVGVAVLAVDGGAEERARAMLDRAGLQPVPWALVRRRLLSGEDPGVDGALLLLTTAGLRPVTLLDVGLALGALGRRALVVDADGRGLPDALADVEVVRYDPDILIQLLRGGQRAAGG
jgi:hypothetical protein